MSLQRYAANRTEPASVPPIVHQVLRFPGQPLDPGTRSFMEPRFGHDFSHVRVHTGAQAAQSAQEVNALAYTVGEDVVFGTGQYAPSTSSGKKLLAHELAHVIQQRSKLAWQSSLQVGPSNDPLEREADGASEKALQAAHVSSLSRSAAVSLQRKPDVGYSVHDLNRRRGRLDDPDQTIMPGAVNWDLSFAVPSPLEAEADVDVTGAPGDPCAGSEIGFLQTVHTNWLHFYYWGRSAGDGSAIVKTWAPNPIRDGEVGSMWYSSDSNAKPTACGARVHTSMDDYPTIFSLAKYGENSKTGKMNYLTGVRRGIGFVTTLVASSATGVHPLRFFYWNYQMSIDFTPNYSDPDGIWPFHWNMNQANIGNVLTGGSSSVPLYTTATRPYNTSLTSQTIERS